MQLRDELALAFEAAESVSYGAFSGPVSWGRSTAFQSSKRDDVGNKVRCSLCGGRALEESMRLYRPGEEKVIRVQTTCQEKPACPVQIRDNHPSQVEPEGMIESAMNAMPLCACGCGKRVKSPGRKLASRQCIGAYNATRPGTEREDSGELTAVDLLEQSIRLVEHVPRSARSRFFQRVVEMVNSAEDMVTGG